MDELREFELTGTLSPKEQPEPEKRSLLDRIFGESMGNSSKAVAKMLLVIVFVFGFTILSDELSTAAFGAETVGNEFSIGFGFVTSFVLARLAWVVKY